MPFFDNDEIILTAYTYTDNGEHKEVTHKKISINKYTTDCRIHRATFKHYSKSKSYTIPVDELCELYIIHPDYNISLKQFETCIHKLCQMQLQYIFN